MTQPSPIGGKNSDREEDDDFLNFCKNRPHENGGQGNNAGSNKMTSDAGAIFRSVTADDDNAPVVNDGNADFSTAILMGNLSASNSNQVKRVAGPSGWVSNAMQGVSVPMNVKQVAAHFRGQMKMPTAGVPAPMSSAVVPQQKAPTLPTPLMPTTSPLKRQSAPSKSNHSTRATTAAGKHGREAADQTYVERWTCDVCKTRSFDTFEEANSHEISCKILHDAKKKKEREGTVFPWEQKAQQQQQKEAPPKRKKKKTQEEEKLQSALNNLVLTAAASSSTNRAMPIAGPARHPNLALIPSAERSNVLSQYNNLLVRHVEFFYPAASHLDYDNLSGSMNGSLMSRNRLGLRCIRCKDSPNHVTAAAFFPRTIGSIASGLGTIGTRHFGWGKCPFAEPQLVEQMMEAKKTSSSETRARGRMGLDAYCKDFASRCGIYDDELSGICWEEGSNPGALVQMAPPLSSTTSASVMETDQNAVAALLAGMKNSTNIETRSFVPTETPNFWECNGCRMVPLDFRAKGSVVFSVCEPSNDQVGKHLSECGRNKPLTIPHNATIESFYGEQVPPIKVTWNSNSNSELSPVAPVVASSSGRKSRRSSSNVSVKSGTEDGLLCFDEDKEYTTDVS
mmetsp:Transcript_21507/g.43152  ORF Transcript_21507/g.43152 Transcript_21507/m.43152 type:complete len:622 (+) Transcript_21507:2650-4515(+)